MSISDTLFLRALNKEKLNTPPIWYMRQAGRYMPEYREVRKKFKNFLDMCKEPDVCCEIALQPINAFQLDASILFSDILTIPDAFGLGVSFVENEGPVFTKPINSPIDINNLNHFDLFYNEIKNMYKVSFVKNVDLFTVRHFTENSLEGIYKLGTSLVSLINKNTAQIIIQKK